GPKWTALLELWLAYEHINGFSNVKHGLKAASRPTELSEWMKKERPATGVALYSLDSISLFVDRFWTWWCSLQPSWRSPGLNNRPGPLDGYGTTWTSLDKPGQNGWFGLIICLKWW
ncbi:hypothetical protein C8R42DRAFT_558688, partial [Lentinula raphanica]